jgi:hypothetical protein
VVAAFVIAAKLRRLALLSACAAGGSFLVFVREGAGGRFCVLAGRVVWLWCLQLCAGVAVFVIVAKLRLASLLYACAAGGSFLVLARKEPKKPLLGLGGLQSCKCTYPYVRTLTELATDGLAPYVR